MNAILPMPRREFSFFEDDSALIPHYPCKVYHDGSHYVATYVTTAKPRSRCRECTELDEAFEEVYARATIEENLPEKEVIPYVFNKLYESYSDNDELYTYVESNVDRKRHNTYLKLKRLRRKAFLNDWTYFATFTYDDAKQSEESFRTRLKKCLSNLSTRRGWRCMGVFERAPETRRLHFHCLLYVPEGEMLGFTREEEYYSTKHKLKMRAFQNSFFFDTFGRNDLQRIDTNKFSVRKCVGYITKYLEKTGENIMYSRGIPTELNVGVLKDDIANEFFDFVQKFAIYDDVFETSEEAEDLSVDASCIDLYKMLC